MTSTAFDTLGYVKKLEAAGFTRQQAEVQAEVFLQFAENQNEKNRNELATKGDLRETELRLQKEMQQVKYELLKWQIGGWIALAAIMAKGFGWLGF